MTVKFERAVEVQKVDASLGLVFGFAMVCKVDGEPYFDLQDEHIPEDVMLKGSLAFMQGARTAKEMHAGAPVGTVIYAFPLTTDIAKSLGIETKKTGLLVAMRPSQDVLAKFVDGSYKGFSIGGQATYEDVK